MRCETLNISPARDHKMRVTIKPHKMAFIFEYDQLAVFVHPSAGWGWEYRVQLVDCQSHQTTSNRSFPRNVISIFKLAESKKFEN